MNVEKELPIFLFHEGKNYEAYKIFIPFKTKLDNVSGWMFRVWAPSAESVSVVGDFNAWQTDKNVMGKLTENIWEIFIPKLKVYDNYKYAIKNYGKYIFKTDPYAVHCETSPSNASKLYDTKNYKWQDKDYLKKRKKYDSFTSPLNIYEIHLGSWKKNEEYCINYRDLADDLVAYVKEMGYTHIELLPITEYPFDGSWGYQVTGLFAPTSRYGTPHDFMYFVDKCHSEGIGVILDWVIAHFPKDEHGLYEFDGTKLYENNDKVMCEHKEWGTRIFDYGKKEVKSYLISSAMYWFDMFHIDGIRVDAVASMLYLDYGRNAGQWKANVFGGNYNLEAIDFIKELNTAVLTKHSDVIMIAEESTAFPLVTKPAYDGGLGFNYKWNMGWMNDMLSYVSMDSYFRAGNHNKVTFSISYAFSENYILPLSHDEVVHGKKSIVDKMFGSYEEKFESAKALYGYMIAHPGKKLNFMGNEFGQFIEWDFKNQLDWLLLDFECHKNLKKYTKDLNHLYLNNTALYELDNSYDGFKWICVDDCSQNILSFKRCDAKGNYVVVIINFSPITRENYDMGIPELKTYKTILNSKSKTYGGEYEDVQKFKAKKGGLHSENYHISLTIPAYCCMFLETVQSKSKSKSKVKAIKIVKKSKTDK